MSTDPTVLALSAWAHFTWLPGGERARTERAQAHANADLLVRFPQLASLSAASALPPFARLPRPACARLLRVSAALAHAPALRRVVSADARKRFAVRIAPRVLQAIQRDGQTLHDAEARAPLNVLDREAMTAAGLRLALCALDDETLRTLMKLRMPRAVAQRAAQLDACETRAELARALLDAAHALLQRGDPC